MDAQLSQGLTFLAWTSGIFLIVVGIFVIKLLFDLSRLTCNMNKSAEIVKNEIEPIMKNVGESAATINKMVQTTDKKVGKFTETYDKISNISYKSICSIRLFLKNSMQRFIFSIKRFMEK